MYEMDRMQSVPTETVLWLSQLGMQDPSLVEHLECLASVKTEQLAAFTCEYPSNCNSGVSSTFAPGELQKAQKNFGTDGNLSALKYFDDYLDYQKPEKVPRLSCWEVPNNQTVIKSPWQKQAHALPYDQQHKFQFDSDDKYTFGDYLPQLQDEILDLAAAHTPIIQGDVRGSPASAKQKSMVSDVLSGETLSSSNTSNLILTQSELRGKRKSDQLFSDGTSLKATISQDKPSGHAVDHIMAERKRREKLSQRFIALSAVIPGLKKMDKATVLGDAIKYVKQLQDRVKVLEDQTSRKVSRAVSSNEFPTCQQQDERNGTVDAHVFEDYDQLPEIGVRMVDESVLIKVHCERKKGIVVKIFAELEKLHLQLTNAQILTFSKTELDLTFTAQVEKTYDPTVDTIMQALQSLFRSLD